MERKKKKTQRAAPAQNEDKKLAPYFEKIGVKTIFQLAGYVLSCIGISLILIVDFVLLDSFKQIQNMTIGVAALFLLFILFMTVLVGFSAAGIIMYHDFLIDKGIHYKILQGILILFVLYALKEGPKDGRTFDLISTFF